MTSVGFTGTRHGMTNAQVLEVHMLLGDLQTAGAKEAHHGMCVGADKEFHDMAVAMSYRVIGHPGVTMGGGKPHHRAAVACDLVMPSKPFLVRNRDIVRESHVVIACPYERLEQRQASGTWATIRYTRQAKKPLIILYPDGSSTVEQVPGMPITVEEYRRGLWV